MTSKTSTLRNEVLALADAMCNGIARPEQLQRLNELLSTDIRCRQWYVEHLDLHAELFEAVTAHSEEQIATEVMDRAIFRPVMRERFSLKMIGSATAVVAALSLMIALWVMWYRIPQPVAARLTQLSDDARSADRELQLGHVLRVSDQFLLDEGFAAVETSHGAIVHVAAPAILTFTGTNSLRLTSGEIASTVPPSAVGFRVDTRDATVIDLGTEFYVKRLGQNGTDVSVRQGKVSARLLDQSGAELQIVTLNGGSAAQLNCDREELTEVGYREAAYERFEVLGRGIEQTSGRIRLVGSPPRNLSGGQYLTEENLALFKEAQGVTLQEAVIINTLSGPRTLQPGTVVDSYLIHYDPPEALARPLIGSLTFRGPVLAVIGAGDELVRTDRRFGLPSIRYSDERLRGIEPDHDHISHSVETYSVSFDFGIQDINRLDEVRVLVLAEEAMQ
ncbi:FecR domain-containing protein [Calycomorphotria hydatis]|uniref:FecR protein n=1 Tax=Calycomorphotria hydatis TaxID=2528027 RepID=A0A517T8P5_9PLAN|nr:FecR domain-containing protein [Calycomorphotria hydatis]QDT64729.1 FecR protein [Calycomorphotria hydatis]